MNNAIDTYSVSAKYYDAVYDDPAFLDDVPFWVELAERSRGPVLEIACGTGRVLLPIARQRIQIDGLDNSEPLLAILREKLRTEPPEVSAKVRLHSGDMRSFDLRKTYRLVTIPFRPLQHMHIVEDQVAALVAAKRHLAPGGELAFNVFYPDFRFLDTELGAERLEREWSDADGQTVKRFLRVLSIDRLHQWFDAEMIFRTYSDSSVFREEIAPIRMSWFTYPHMELLFRAAGLRIVEEYGSFKKQPISICKEMIFVLRAEE